MSKRITIDPGPGFTAWADKNFPSARQGLISLTETAHMGLDQNPMAAMFADPNQAMEFMLQSWKSIWRHTLIMLKGRFSAGELSLILDCHNSHAVSPQMYGSLALYHQVSDAIALDGLAEKWEIDPDRLKAEIKELTPIQALVLEVWSVGFWYGQNKAKDFDGYLKTLV